MDADLGPYAGDVAGLLEYRRTTNGMRPIDPRRPFGPLGHIYIAVLPSVDSSPPRTTLPTLAELLIKGPPEPPGHNPWHGWHDPTAYETVGGDRIISAALAVVGIVLTIAAYSALIFAISKGWI